LRLLLFLSSSFFAFSLYILDRDASVFYILGVE
jgi:hypothetical protein